MLDQVLEVIRASADNNERKKAEAQLIHIFDQQPLDFLQYTWLRISTPTTPTEQRFFLCTTVATFVTDYWRNGVPRSEQERVLAQYVQLALTEHFPSLTLARKVGIIIALMARRGGADKVQLGQQLPVPVQHVATAYSEAITQQCSIVDLAGTSSMARLSHLLMLLHVFLKEVETKRVGHVYEALCAMMVQPVSLAFTTLGNATGGGVGNPTEQPDAFLFLLKCSRRVFGSGVFEPTFYTFLLDVTWRLTAGLGSADGKEEQRGRLLEYAVKIQEKMVTYFPSDLQKLPVTFFVASPEAQSSLSSSGGGGTVAGGAADHSLFNLVCSIVESRAAGVVSEKAVCRALRLLTLLFSAEDGDSFIAEVLLTAAQSPLLRRLTEAMVVHYLSDDISAEAYEGWVSAPELAIEELDIDMDNEEDAMCCAEQLFLALTGSTGCAAYALEAAWEIVNRLLGDGSERSVTAALHAIGIGYYTMSSGDDGSASYVQFMQSHLLPIIRSAVTPPGTTQQQRPTPFVLRRVVWLVGMWCESVTDPSMRRDVHAALDALLQSEESLVILLVTLRATENFISDNNFTLEELTPRCVPTVLESVRRVLPHLRLPSSVRMLAGLVHVLVAKEAVMSQGEDILNVFAPAVIGGIQKVEKGSESADSYWAAHHDDDDDDQGDFTSMLGMLLECLSGVVSICTSDAAIWGMFHPVIVPCTTPEAKATPWAADCAWELLLAMARGSHSFALPEQEQALTWCLQNMARDFAMLHLSQRTLFTLLVLRRRAVEEVLTEGHIDTWMEALTVVDTPELQGSLTALLLTVARMSGGPLRTKLLSHCVAVLTNCAEVQSSDYALSAAQILSVCLQSSDVASIAQDFVTTVSQHPRCLPEQVALLIDVSPSSLSTRCLARVLVALQQAGLVASEEEAMVRYAIEGALEDVPAVDPDAEVRPFDEMLLELFGDEELQMSSPHMTRMVAVFGLLP